MLSFLQSRHKSIEKSLKIWETNANLENESNQFHRDVVRPKVLELLNVQKNDCILDVACSNGNFVAYSANLGAKVVAFDYSQTMIKLAKKDIVSEVIDATNKKQLSLHPCFITLTDKYLTLHSYRDHT